MGRQDVVRQERSWAFVAPIGAGAAGLGESWPVARWFTAMGSLPRIAQVSYSQDRRLGQVLPCWCDDTF